MSALFTPADWLTTATLTRLVLEHDAIVRVLNLPGAELFRGYALKMAQCKALGDEIERRKAEARSERICAAIEASVRRAA